MPEMIEFYLNDQLVRTSEPAASALLDFVRYHEYLTGTKIGCREGACTVLVGELATDGQTVNYQSMTSCLTPLGNVQGKHVVTVEGINAASLRRCSKPLWTRAARSTVSARWAS